MKTTASTVLIVLGLVMLIVGAVGGQVGLLPMELISGKNTLYFRSDKHTVNGLAGYQLKTVNSLKVAMYQPPNTGGVDWETRAGRYLAGVFVTPQLQANKLLSSTWIFRYYGGTSWRDPLLSHADADVSIRCSNGTEVALGSHIAESNDFPATAWQPNLVTGQWLCPEASLPSGSILVVRLYVHVAISQVRRSCWMGWGDSSWPTRIEEVTVSLSTETTTTATTTATSATTTGTTTTGTVTNGTTTTATSSTTTSVAEVWGLPPLSTILMLAGGFLMSIGVVTRKRK